MLGAATLAIAFSVYGPTSSSALAPALSLSLSSPSPRPLLVTMYPRSHPHRHRHALAVAVNHLLEDIEAQLYVGPRDGILAHQQHQLKCFFVDPNLMLRHDLRVAIDEVGIGWW